MLDQNYSNVTAHLTIGKYGPLLKIVSKDITIFSSRKVVGLNTI